MTPSNIQPVILSGEKGTRLWPLSRKAMPKQFARLDGDLSLLQSTVQRMEDSGFMRPLMVSNNAYRFTVGEQLAEIGAEGAQILIEPEGRNTGPAICAAAEFLKGQVKNTLMLVAPSDHLIRDQLAFARAVAAGVPHAKEGHVVAFGIRPDRAETGYGYIDLSNPSGDDDIAQEFRRFVEKPNADIAEGLFHSNRHVWNAGIFLLSVSTALRLFNKYQPLMQSHVRLAVQDLKYDLDFARLGPSYADAPSVSFDTAIMENTTGYVVPFSPGWADLGNWRSVWETAERNDRGVVTNDNALAIDCDDTLLRGDGVKLVGVGLKNIAAVAMANSVLITDLDAAQNVSLAVKAMRDGGIAEADTAPRHHRPWGHYETLSLGERFQVKSIVVKPGGKLSLQSHVHRAERWVVVDGTATVTIGKQRRMIGENQSVFIPMGEIHRLENEGKMPLQLIEVQSGSHLGEDDITRYEDIYART